MGCSGTAAACGTNSTFLQGIFDAAVCAQGSDTSCVQTPRLAMRLAADVDAAAIAAMKGAAAPSASVTYTGFSKSPVIALMHHMHHMAFAGFSGPVAFGATGVRLQSLSALFNMGYGGARTRMGTVAVDSNLAVTLTLDLDGAVYPGGSAAEPNT